MKNTGSQMDSYKEYLQLAGLSRDQALVYEYLLKQGMLPASKIAVGVKTIERTLVYKVLDRLTELGLVLKKDQPGKVAVFEVAHPMKLSELVENQIQKAERAKQAMEFISPTLLSDFNLNVGKPGVEFYEGLDGGIRALKDSLKARGDICSYIDNAAIYKHFSSINEDFVGHRQRLKVKHRILSLDSPEERKYLSKESGGALTEVRLLPFAAALPSLLRIYDDTICIQTLDPDNIMSILIHDGKIAALQRMLFEMLWVQAKPFEK